MAVTHIPLGGNRTNYLGVFLILTIFKLQKSIRWLLKKFDHNFESFNLTKNKKKSYMIGVEKKVSGI